MKKNNLKRTLLNLAIVLIFILSITSCRKDLYVGDDNLSGLSTEVTQAAKWYNSQLLTISKDSSFTAKNHPEWNQTTVNNQKSNSIFNVPVYKEGAISRELKINRFGNATFSGTIKEYDRTLKSMTKVVTYSINGKFLEEGVLYPTGQYRLLRSAGKEQSARTLSLMGSEGGGSFPDEPTFPDIPTPGNPTNPTTGDGATINGSLDQVYAFGGNSGASDKGRLSCQSFSFKKLSPSANSQEAGVSGLAFVVDWVSGYPAKIYTFRTLYVNVGVKQQNGNIITAGRAAELAADAANRAGASLTAAYYGKPNAATLMTSTVESEFIALMNITLAQDVAGYGSVSATKLGNNTTVKNAVWNGPVTMIFNALSGSGCAE